MAVTAASAAAACEAAAVAMPSAVYGRMLIVNGNSKWSSNFTLRIASKSNSNRLRWMKSTGGSLPTHVRFTASTYSPLSHLYLLSPSSTSPSTYEARPSRTDFLHLTSIESV